MQIVPRFSALRIASLAFSTLLFMAHGVARGETIEEIYDKAKREGGVLTLYGTMSAKTSPVLLPAFEKRFPGVKINLVDATGDKLVARAVAEARGGRVLGDVFNSSMAYVLQVREQGLLLDKVPPEADGYPANLKGSYWVATDLQFIVAAWNTSLVKKGEEPKQFEDFADPRWKNRLIAEPRDFMLLMGLAKYKYKNDEKAISLMKKIAANSAEFHKGHSQLAELLVAGQAPACLTCLSHHFPPRMQRGAPVNYMLSEGVGEIGMNAIFKDAPHPNTAWLWTRWAVSEEGQKVYAQAGETPGHPKVEPLQRTRPAQIYALSPEDWKDAPKYQKIWREIFGLR